MLFSGGIDSTACLSFYKERKLSVYGLFIDYGQPSAKRELDAVDTIAKQFDIRVVKTKLICSKTFTDGLIVGRNAFLIITALLSLPKRAEIISLGIHSGTNYADCSKIFIQSMQDVINIYAHGSVQIDVPFIDWSKLDIIKYCKRNSIELENTYSCELGYDQPCNKCTTCKEIKELYAM